MSRFLFLMLLSFVFADEFLEPKDAFKSTFSQTKTSIIFELKLGSGIYVYADKLKIKDDNIDITSSIKLPTPVKHDEFIVYYDVLKIDIPNSLLKGSKVSVDFQGCSKDGLCYQPMSENFEFKSKQENTTKTLKNETDTIADTLKNGDLWLILITFFGFGVLLSLTPCIFPMIPILSSIIVKHSNTKEITSQKGFFLSLIYVLAMAFAYTIAGVLAGLFGANLQVALQNQYVLFVFAGIFVALAFSMFGYFEIGLPTSLQSKISQKSDNQQGIIGIAVMGFLSALIVGPCVAPPLAGALVYIGQTGDAMLGGLALFIMSIGMGLPLLGIGLGAGKFMPKTGIWMQNISKIFGVIMLGVAIWMIQRVIPPILSMILWAVLLMGSSVYLGAFEPFKEHTHGVMKLTKLVGLVLFIYGVVIFIGGVSGAKNILNPMEPFIVKQSIVSDRINFELVSTIKELDEKIAKSDKPIMLDFYADWCTSCKEYDEITFKNSMVIAKMQGFKILRVDVTKNSDEDKRLLEKFGLFGPPAIIFWDKNKNQINEAKLVGYKDPEQFLTHINKFFKE